MKIYVASSWRNTRQPEVVSALRNCGHEVYDFRNPAPGEHGFSWSEIDPNWKQWTEEEFIAALNHPIAVAGFESDERALSLSAMCVLVMPCGRSAHLEAGFACGTGRKLLAVLLSDTEASEPELMYRWAEWIGSDLSALCEFANQEDVA